MSRNKKTNYITLQEYMTTTEQKRITKAIVRALPIVAPSNRFIKQLKSDLMIEAAQHLQSRSASQQVLKTMGFIGGSALSILGVVWLLNHREDHPTDIAHLTA